MKGTPGESTQSPLPWRSNPGLVGLLVLLMAGNLLLPLGYRLHPLVPVLDYGGAMGLSLLASVLCFRRAGATGPRAFRWLGLGMGFSALHYVPVFLQLPHYRAADAVLLVASLVATGTGLFLWPQRLRMPGERIRTLLDGLMIALSVILAAWMLLERELQTSNLPTTLLLLYALLVGTSFGLLALWLVQESRISLPEQSRSATLVRLAVLALAMHMLLGALLRVLDRYTGYQAHATDALNQVAVTLIALAALLPAEHGERPLPRSRAGWRALIPSLVAVSVLLLAGFRLLAHGTPIRLPFLILGLITLGTLITRQGLLILDLDRLSQDLEARVEERTQRLEAHHREVLRQQRMQMVAALAAGLAHDLNNLVSILRLRVGLLLERASPEIRPDLQILADATERAAAMTRRILTADRGQAPSPQTFDLAEWLEDRAILLRAQLSPGQTLRMEIPSSLPVVADPEQLDQVVQNLASNAREAMGEGGLLWLSARKEHECAVLEVADTGPGIPQANLAQIFDPFFTTKPHGTGLGLATVRNLVLQNRGTISVDSSPQGTRFRVELPSGDGGNPAPAPQP